jgi:predicted membrane protein
MAKPSLPTTRLVFGASAILLGVLFMLDNFHVIYAADYLAYWPALLVVLGLVKFIQPGTSSRAWGVVLIVVGGVLLLRALDLYYIRFRDLWPLLLILVGGAMLWGTFVRRNVSTEGIADEALLNATAIVGGLKRTITSQDFRGGEVTAVMGGCEIDLRQAAIRGEEAVINIFAFWGGVELRVPEAWAVEMKGIPILGGFADETKATADPRAKRLVVTGTAIMGGAGVKN